MKPFCSIILEDSIEQPTHSLDLTPINFFYFYLVKNKVYERNLKTLKELRVYFYDNQNLCSTVCENII